MTLTKIRRHYYNPNPLDKSHQIQPNTISSSLLRLFLLVHASTNSKKHTKSFKILIVFFILQVLFKYSSGSPINCEESTEHCTCSMRDTLEYFNKAAVISRSVLNRAPDAVSQRIQSFQCRQYEQLPKALIIKWSEVEDEYRMTMAKRQRFTRSQRSTRKRPRLSRGHQSLQGQSQDPLPPMQTIKIYTGNSHNYNQIESDPNHRTRRLSRRQRQVPLGYPSNELFGQVIPKLPPKSLHRYVPLGAEVVLPCFGPEDIIEESPWLERKFHWTHSSGRSVSAGDMSVDKSSGDLTLKAVSLSDSDIYNCLVTYQNEDTEDPQTLTYSQQLDVVAEPIAWLKFSIIYAADNCDHEEMILIQENLVKWVHQYVCFFCPVRNNSVRCISNGEDRPSGGDGAYQDVQIRLAISTLGMEHRMTTFHSYSEACPLPCVESLHLKILQIVRNSLEKLFSLEIDIEGSEGKTSVYSPNRESLDADLAMGCPSGFFENFKLCFPCPAGQYSPNGNSECLNCPVSYYQPTPGSSICFPCPQGYGTLGDGTMAEFDCKVEFFASAMRSSTWITIMLTLFGVIIPILLLVCLIPYFCPNTFLGKWFACCSCCGPDPEMDPNTERRSSKDQNYPTGGGYTNLQTQDEGATTDDDAIEFKPISDRRRAYENVDDGPSRGGFRVDDRDKSSKEDSKHGSKKVRSSTKKFKKAFGIGSGRSLFENRLDRDRKAVGNVEHDHPKKSRAFNNQSSSSISKKLDPPSVIPTPPPMPLLKTGKKSKSVASFRRQAATQQTPIPKPPPLPISSIKSYKSRTIGSTPKPPPPPIPLSKSYKPQESVSIPKPPPLPLSKSSPKSNSMSSLLRQATTQTQQTPTSTLPPQPILSTKPKKSTKSVSIPRPPPLPIPSTKSYKHPSIPKPSPLPLPKTNIPKSISSLQRQASTQRIQSLSPRPLPSSSPSTKSYQQQTAYSRPMPPPLPKNHQKSHSAFKAVQRQKSSFSIQPSIPTPPPLPIPVKNNKSVRFNQHNGSVSTGVTPPTVKTFNGNLSGKNSLRHNSPAVPSLRNVDPDRGKQPISDSEGDHRRTGVMDLARKFDQRLSSNQMKMNTPVGVVMNYNKEGTKPVEHQHSGTKVNVNNNNNNNNNHKTRLSQHIHRCRPLNAEMT